MNWPFLKIDCPTAERSSDHQIGLAAEKGGNLENSTTSATLATSTVSCTSGENWNAQLIFDFFQYTQAFL